MNEDKHEVTFLIYCIYLYLTRYSLTCYIRFLTFDINVLSLSRLRLKKIIKAVGVHLLSSVPTKFIIVIYFTLSYEPAWAQSVEVKKTILPNSCIKRMYKNSFFSDW